MRTRTPWATWALLALGVGIASASGVLARYASKEHLGDAGPLAISFWRCAAGAAALLPWAARDLLRNRYRLRPAVLAGVFLAIHFATWITSLDLTTLAASVLLVSLGPVFTAVVGRFWLDERIGLRGWSGIGLALAGTALVVGGSFGGSRMMGNLLALAGGAMGAGYIMAGHVARKSMGILPYAVVAYAVSALLLLPSALVAGQPLTGYGTSTWIALSAITIGPQLLGHTVINFVLKELDATTVAVSVMAEPIIATALAFLLFEEVPGALIYPGGVAILAGIYYVSTVARPPVVIE